MSGKPIGDKVMSAAERQRRRRAKLKAAQDSAGGSADRVTPQSREASGRFPRGVSGNPGGRPRAALDVQALAREYTSQAIDTLFKALDSERHCVAAASALLDRGWGKPPQAITGDTNHPIAHIFEWRDALPETMRPDAARPLEFQWDANGRDHD